MAEKKYYVVKVGKVPGIYFNWPDCQAQVVGFPGAIYKGFKTLEEAEAFLGKDTRASVDSGSDELVLPENYAFVDGSFNSAEKRYGYGGFLVVNGEKHIVTGDGVDEEMAAMRNVAGEISGATAAIKLAMELGVKELTVFYDYEGICQWADGNWKTNKEGTKAYAMFVKEARATGIKIEFVHVKGHSGIPGNEEADMLAKAACGVE